MRGISLLKRAEKAGMPRAAGYYEAAFRRFAEAVEIRTQTPEAWISWGHGLYNLARKQTGKDQQRGFRGACEKYEIAHRHAPDDFDALKFWGLSLRGLARNKREKDPQPLFREACEKFSRAAEIQDKSNDSHHHWGLTLYQMAEKKQGPQAEQLLREACEKFSLACESAANPAVLTLNDWGAALMALSALAQPADARELRMQAREICLQAEKQTAGSASYNLACIASMNDDPEECREYLEIARSHYKIPSPGQLENDPDLGNVRQQPWFRQLVRQVREEF